MKDKKAFTLIELMVVVIIIAILAAIAIPLFNRSMENAREQEARTVLELVYNAQKIYKLDRKTYSDSFANMTDYLDDPNSTAEYYDYTVTGDAVAFIATATRKNDASRVLTITESGNVTP